MRLVTSVEWCDPIAVRHFGQKKSHPVPKKLGTRPVKCWDRPLVNCAFYGPVSWLIFEIERPRKLLVTASQTVAALDPNEPHQNIRALACEDLRYFPFA